MNVGDVFATNYWGDAEVVELLGGRNVVIRFVSTGNIKQTRSDYLLLGNVKDSESAASGAKSDKKVPKSLGSIPGGTKFKSNFYGEVEVIEFVHSKNIQIRFLDTGNVAKVQRSVLILGQVQDAVLRDALIAEKSALAEAASIAFWDERAALLERNRVRDVEAIRLKEAAIFEMFTNESSKRIGQRVADKMGEAFTVTSMVSKGLWKITYEATGNVYEISETMLDSLYGVYDSNQPDFERLKKQKDAKANAASYDSNRLHRIAMASAYQKNNIERTRERNRRNSMKRSCADGSHTLKEKASLLLLQKGKCNSCGYDLANGKHIDHIMPISLGGSDYVENMQWLCQICNNVKAGRHPDEWAVYSVSDEYKARLSLRRK